MSSVHQTCRSWTVFINRHLLNMNIYPLSCSPVLFISITAESKASASPCPQPWAHFYPLRDNLISFMTAVPPDTLSTVRDRKYYPARPLTPALHVWHEADYSASPLPRQCQPWLTPRHKLPGSRARCPRGRRLSAAFDGGKLVSRELIICINGGYR